MKVEPTQIQLCRSVVVSRARSWNQLPDLGKYANLYNALYQGKLRPSSPWTAEVSPRSLPLYQASDNKHPCLLNYAENVLCRKATITICLIYFFYRLQIAMPVIVTRAKCTKTYHTALPVI